MHSLNSEAVTVSRQRTRVDTREAKFRADLMRAFARAGIRLDLTEALVRRLPADRSTPAARTNCSQHCASPSRRRVASAAAAGHGHLDGLHQRSRAWERTCWKS